MIESIYFKIGLVCLGCLMVLSVLVDFRSLASKFIFRSKKNNDSNQQNDFLELIELWYKLKYKCNECKLDIASDKLDEVFPLLNKVLEDEKTT